MLWNADNPIDKTQNPPHLVPPHDYMRNSHGTGLSKTNAGEARSRDLRPALVPSSRRRERGFL